VAAERKRADHTDAPLRIVVAEGIFLVREALVSVLDDAPEIELVAACDDLEELPRAVDEHRPDVVLADVGTPGGVAADAVRLLGELVRRHSALAFVVLSSRSEARDAISLLALGTDRRAYLLRERVYSRRQLVSIIQSVARGGSVVDAKVLESLAEPRAPARELSLELLSGRERAVLEAMAQGASNAGIARSLRMPKRAVERHVNAIFSKLDVPPADDVSRRVYVVLLYLAATGQEASPEGHAPPSARIGGLRVSAADSRRVRGIRDDG
jgi:DNA-binding NarL/FixJ family response regulator